MAFNPFNRNRTALLAAAALVALVLVGLFIVVASGAEDGSGDGMDLDPGTPAASPSPPPASPSTTTPPAGSQGGGSGIGGTTLRRVPAAGDPDRPVSSEDPLPAPRPAPSPPDDGIDSFEDCVRAGYPIAESYPEQCFTPDGRSFTRSIP